MKNTRRGLGKGMGTGYKNLAPMDSHIHSISAKGVKSKTPMISPKKNIDSNYMNIKNKVQNKGYIVNIDRYYISKGYPLDSVVRVRDKGQKPEDFWWVGTIKELEEDYNRGMFK